jgi:hypothetical protein
MTAASVYSLAYDPSGSALYAGTRDGGVFRSGDGGSSWTPVNAGLTNPTVFSLAFDPASPSILYAGTYGGGVFGYEAAAAPAAPSRRVSGPVPPSAPAELSGRR